MLVAVNRETFSERPDSNTQSMHKRSQTEKRLNQPQSKSSYIVVVIRHENQDSNLALSLMNLPLIDFQMLPRDVSRIFLSEKWKETNLKIGSHSFFLLEENKMNILLTHVTRIFFRSDATLSSDDIDILM